STAAESPTSQPIAIPPSSAAVSLAAASFMSTTHTRAPSAVSRRAVPCPMPDAPPVTNATCLSNRPMRRRLPTPFACGHPVLDRDRDVGAVVAGVVDAGDGHRERGQPRDGRQLQRAPAYRERPRRPHLREQELRRVASRNPFNRHATVCT